VIEYGTNYTCGHGEPYGDCPKGCQNPDVLAGLRTGDWLDAQHFQPLRYAVPGILPEGSTLLVGPPKIGKSWAVLDLLLSIAAGGRAFGAIPTGEPRPVLYLALEDGDRRLQDRCRKLLNGGDIPKRFQYMTTIPVGRLVDVVAEWTARNPDAAAVVLDTLGKVMPQQQPGESAYQRDYRVGGRLKRLADEHDGLALLTNHHDRKAGAEDFVETVSGTHGLAGAADTIIVLSRARHETDGLLKVTGRDVAEGEYALNFRDGCAWQVAGVDLGAAADVARSRRAISALGDQAGNVVAFVNESDGVRAADVAAACGIDERTAGTYLARLANANRIDKITRGLYGPRRPDVAA
jgi:hypothetical protein